MTEYIAICSSLRLSGQYQRLTGAQRSLLLSVWNQYLLFLLLQQYLFAVIYLTTWFSMIYLLAIWHGETYSFLDMFSSYIRYLLSFFLLANISEMLKRTKNKMLSTMPFISAYLLLLIDEQVIQSVTNRNGITIRLIFSWTFQPLGLVLLPIFLAITTLLLLQLNRTYDIFWRSCEVKNGDYSKSGI